MDNHQMDNQRTIETEAKTPEEAIEIALRELDADRGEVEIDVVSRGKPGILGFGSEPARVRVTLLDQPSDIDQPADIVAVTPDIVAVTPDIVAVTPDIVAVTPDIVTVTTDILNNLIDKMGVDVVASLTQADSDEMEGPVFNIDGDDSGLLIGRRGETLRSLQFLVNFMARRQVGEKTRIMLDVAGYQQRRINSLKSMASRVASRVASSGRSIALEPMPANERRIVHLELSDRSDVTTESMGDGNSRQVVVQPRLDD